jgi:predicted secreted Zn-dependent protease
VNSRLLWQHLFAVAVVALPAVASAQTIHWTTNFYSVTGANFREIRQSIATSHPWKDGFDGDTQWRVQWSYQLTPTPNGCSCTSFRTTTTITTTLPRWTPPDEVMPEVKEQWTRYFTNLMQHEAGHARIGMVAAAEVDRQVRQNSTASDCESLGKAINERAERIVENHRAKDREYDQRTNHGRPTNDPPWRARGPREPRRY